jgi:GNAT superfamily N-acetyltransferase
VTDLSIRSAAIDDLPAIVEMKLQMFREAGHAKVLAGNAGELVLEDYRRMYQAGSAHHFIACGPAPVAMAGAFLKSDIPFRYFANPTYGFIGDVYTSAHLRRRGLAKHLNELALEWLRTQNVSMVRLLASVEGRALYQKLGFVPSDEMVLADAS